MIALLILIQLLLYTIKQAVFLLTPQAPFTDSIASFIGMSILTVCFFMIAARRKIDLSVFPKKFGPSYIIATLAAAVMLLAAPSNFTGEAAPIVLLVYGSVVVPVFEETIFRGFVWNKLNTVFTREWQTYALTTVLFSLWHVGYIDAIALRVNDGLFTVMVWKVITRLCFGVVLGALRLKTRNCYSTMLLHGIMNLFGR